MVVFLTSIVKQVLYSFTSEILFCGEVFITKFSAITISWSIVGKIISSAKGCFGPGPNVSLRCIFYEHVLDSRVSKEQNRLFRGCKEILY